MASVPIANYEEFVAVRLNDSFLEARESVRLVDCFRVAMGTARMPRWWIDAVAGDSREAAAWHGSELQREFRRDRE